jgi:hypothetical protein
VSSVRERPARIPWPQCVPWEDLALFSGAPVVDAIAEQSLSDARSSIEASSRARSLRSDETPRSDQGDERRQYGAREGASGPIAGWPVCRGDGDTDRAPRHGEGGASRQKALGVAEDGPGSPGVPRGGMRANRVVPATREKRVPSVAGIHLGR